jgi:hypothetical protein
MKRVDEEEYMKGRRRAGEAKVEGVGNDGEKTRKNIKEEEIIVHRQRRIIREADD